tara:strand:+ start:315 stop:467 length:153 start_codon:yes stop_codon:yes gene_type:complete
MVKKKYGSKVKKYIVATNPKGQTYRYAKLADGRIVTVSFIKKKKSKARKK